MDGFPELLQFLRTSPHFQRHVAESPAPEEPADQEELEDGLIQLNKQFLDTCVQNIRDVGSHSSLAPVVVDYLRYTIELLGPNGFEDGKPTEFFTQLGTVLRELVYDYYTTYFKLEQKNSGIQKDRPTSGLLTTGPFLRAPLAITASETSSKETETYPIPANSVPVNGLPDTDSNPLAALQAIGAQKLKGFRMKLQDSEFDTEEFIPNKAIGTGPSTSVSNPPVTSNGKFFGSDTTTSTWTSKSPTTTGGASKSPPTSTTSSARTSNPFFGNVPTSSPSTQKVQPQPATPTGFTFKSQGPAPAAIGALASSTFSFKPGDSASSKGNGGTTTLPSFSLPVTSNGSVFGNGSGFPGTVPSFSSSASGFFSSFASGGSGSTSTFTSGASASEAPPPAGNKAEDDEDEAKEKEAQSHEFTPVVEEAALYTIKSKVFEWDSVKKSYEVRGVGMLHILKLEKGHQLIVRADNALGNVLLNMKLDPEIPIVLEKNNLKTVDPHKSPPQRILIRVRLPTDAAALLEKIQQLIGNS